MLRQIPFFVSLSFFCLLFCFVVSYAAVLLNGRFIPNVAAAASIDHNHQSPSASLLDRSDDAEAFASFFPKSHAHYLLPPSLMEEEQEFSRLLSDNDYNKDSNDNNNSNDEASIRQSENSTLSSSRLPLESVQQRQLQVRPGILTELVQQVRDQISGSYTPVRGESPSRNPQSYQKPEETGMLSGLRIRPEGTGSGPLSEQVQKMATGQKHLVEGTVGAVLDVANFVINNTEKRAMSSKSVGSGGSVETLLERTGLRNSNNRRNSNGGLLGTVQDLAFGGGGLSGGGSSSSNSSRGGLLGLNVGGRLMGSGGSSGRSAAATDSALLLNRIADANILGRILD